MRLMRLVLGVVLMASVVSVFSVAGGTRSAFAAFHCNRIHAVMAGYNGDSRIQFVELREPFAGQNILAGHKMRFYDAGGTLKATFTFPNNATNGVTGESFLIGTAEFNKFTAGGDADYTFDDVNTVASNGGNPLHPIQYPGGKIVFAGEAGDFNCNAGPAPVDSLAYGGATSDFPPAAAALPNPSTTQHLRLHNLNAKPTNNGAEYTPLESVSATTFAVAPANLVTDKTSPRNNQRNVLQITFPVGGVAELPGGASNAQQSATSSDSSNSGLVAGIAAGIAAGAIALGGGAWYARRRIRS